jgi:hypothetical protein
MNALTINTLILPDSIGTTEIQAIAREHDCDVIVLRDNLYRLVDLREQPEQKPARNILNFFKGVCRHDR